MKMRRCEDEKMRYRPPLLEEPCAQTLSGKKSALRTHHSIRPTRSHASGPVSNSLIRRTEHARRVGNPELTG